MNAVDVVCPACGRMNRSLDLEETDGWMECECCGRTTRLIRDAAGEKARGSQMVEVQILVPLSHK